MIKTIKQLLKNIRRKYNTKRFSDVKLISEISAVAHVLNHPNKTKDEIESIRNHLVLLVTEAKLRKLSGRIIEQAEELTKNDVLKVESIVSYDEHSFNTLNTFLKNRKTIRSVKKERFDKQIIYEMIKTAVQAPSSCNRQPWRFLLLEKEEDIIWLSNIKKQSFLKDFPYILFCCYDNRVYQGTDTKFTPYLDCGAVIMNLCNSASAGNIASCWCNFAISSVGNKVHKEFRKRFNISDSIVPVSIIGLGIPNIVTPKPVREDVSYYLITNENDK